MNEIINLGNGQLVKVTMLKGERGSNIASIAKTSTDGLVDTYTITLTDGHATTFQVTNGANIGVANLGYVQTSNVAQKDFAVGNHLILNDQYCKVTQAIEEGDTIAIGTNVDEVVIGDEISDLESRKADKDQINQLATDKANKNEVNQLASEKADKTALAAETNARISADNTEASTRATEDANLQSQIDQIIAPSGEAPSAAEVQNARIGADGVTYDTLGDAIRTQNTNLNNAIKEIVVSPRNRNGSKGNPSNVNCITINNDGYIACDTNYVRCTVNFSKQEGYWYVWEYYLTNNTSSFGTYYIVYTDEPYVDLYLAGNKYFSINVYRRLKTGATYDPVRVENVGYYALKVIMIYGQDNADNVSFYRTNRNGSLGNPSNEYAITISQDGVIPAKSNQIQVFADIAPEDGYEFYWHYYVTNTLPNYNINYERKIYTVENSVVLDFEGYKYIELELYKVSTDHETYVSLRTQNVGNNALRAVYLYNPNKSLNEVAISPMNRNGSMGNRSNPNCITINNDGYIECKTKTIHFTVNFGLQDGCRYMWEYYLTNDLSNFGYYMITYSDEPFIDLDTCNFKYVSINVYRRYIETQEYDPVRVETVGLHALKAIYVYDAPDAEITSFIGTTRNGSVLNVSNAYGISISADGAIPCYSNSIKIITDIEPEDDYQFMWEYYVVDSPNLSQTASRRVAYSYDNEIILNAEGHKYIRLSLFKVQANDHSVYVPLRTQNLNPYSLKAIYLYSRDSRDGESIFAKNLDIEDAVHATNRFGVNGNGQPNYQLQYSLLITTDVHADVTRFRNAIDYLNGIDSIMAGACLGDIVASYANENADWYAENVLHSIKPFFTVIGNHDLGISNDDRAITNEEALTRYITSTESRIGLSDIDTLYYAVYDDTYKMAFIVLDDYDTPNTPDESGYYPVRRGAECFTQTQIDWFINELQSIPSDYHLVILEHSFYNPTININCNFTQPNKTIVGSTPYLYPSSSNIIPSIIDAWKRGTSLTKSVAPSSEYVDIVPTLELDCDFTERGAGDFVCYIVGHQHEDIMAHSATYQDQLVVCLAATACDNWQNYPADLPRVIGCKSEDCITVVGFDTISKHVNLVRIGSNITINMINRTMISLPY